SRPQREAEIALPVRSGVRPGSDLAGNALVRILLHNHEYPVREAVSAIAADRVAPAESGDLYIGRRALLYSAGADGGLHVQRRELDRWSGWPGDRPDGHFRGGTHGPDVYQQPRGAGRLSAARAQPAHLRVDRVLRRHDGGEPGLPLV